jgi:alpha-L-fucosidase 2
MTSSIRPTRRSFVTGTAALAATLAERRAWPRAIAHGEQCASYKLHFGRPASEWPDALPAGNGRLGAMVFGHPAFERIQLNEESIWDGEIRDRNHPRAAAAIPRVRELLFEGRISEAEALASADMFSAPIRLPCYQTLGDLRLDFTPTGLTPETKPEDYRLELDLDTAIVATSFSHLGVRYTREVFSSAPDQVIVVRLTASETGKLTFHAALDRPGDFHSELLPGNRVSLSGQALPVNDNPGQTVKERQTGIRFYAEMWAIKQGGSFETHTTGLPTAPIHIGNATSVTLLIDCATSYRYPASTSNSDRFNTGDQAAMQAAAHKNLAAASRRTYAELRARHIADYQRLFHRADISFGPDPNADLPTDQRVQHIKDGGEDIHLLPIYFQFGRYMLISSSRPGTLAANLQGIWNDSVDPPWGCKYTVNINTEMNYWLAERANLADCHTPLFDLLHTTQRSGSITATKYYNARGSVVHHNTDIWGDSSPIDGLGGGIWAMGSAWPSLHLWDHYDYSGDLGFLLTRAWPTLRDNALFLLDYLMTAPEGTPYAGLLVTGPSCSPENRYKLPDGHSFNLCMGPTMDVAISRAVLTRLIAAAEALGIGISTGHDSVSTPSFAASSRRIGGISPDADLITRAHAALAKLPAYKITHDGRLQEWPEDYADHEPGHRHISHLFGLFPEDQITLASTPKLARAARNTLDKRLAAGSGSTGWSRSWIINCMARLQDGDAAYQNILELIRLCTRHNLFDVCGLKENSPFQIDGNLGAPTGMIEMLLQSHAGILRLLPALPKAWPSGSFRGLRARGRLGVDLEWQNNRATRATLRSTLPRTHIIAPPPGQQIAAIRQGIKEIPFTLQTDGCARLPIIAGATCTLSFS